MDGTGHGSVATGIVDRKNKRKLREPLPKGERFFHRLGKDMRYNTMLYLLMLPGLAYYLIFNYAPMYGIIIAFKSYTPGMSIFGSPWVGFKYFADFFNSYYFERLLRNTFLLSFYSLLWGFPVPIIFALLLNELRSRKFMRVAQTFTYVPHFISIMVVCSLIMSFSAERGIFNDIIAFFGGGRSSILQNPKAFRSVYIASGIWQEAGWGSILYLAALSGINKELFDAADIDGAGRFQKIWNITLPGIAPTVTIMLILRMGGLMSVGFEKVLLLYNDLTMETADVISTFIYRRGLIQADFAYSSAVGLFNSVINCLFLVGANKLSSKISENSLW
ncbi:MAG: ABC transporter permease subunit [Clostridiales bacterium]|nr:ABC transporter permease subunit [Clostridiales bacterium]